MLKFTDGFQVPALAIVHGQRRRVLVDLACNGHRKRFGAQQIQVSLQHMAHDERRAGGQRPIHRGDRIADVAAELMQRGL
jgi:hypothetical protein